VLPILRFARSRKVGRIAFFSKRPRQRTTLYNRGVSTTRADLTDQRLLEAHKSAMSRRWRVQRRHYERDTRRDIDAAGAKIERHHLTEHA
jgi:hypothetical protein